MKKILFVCMGLGIGGTEKTLVEAINGIDYNRFAVEVYLRKSRETYIPLLDKRAKVIVNRNAPQFEQRPLFVICSILQSFFIKIRRKGLADRFRRKGRNYVLRERQKYESCYFEDKMYDCAIAYDMAQECVSFVKDCIPAKKKIAFFHASRMDIRKKIIYEAFDQIVAVNSEVANSLTASYPDLKCKTIAIENYIETDIPPLNYIERPQSDLVLCSCGRFTKEKGFDLALETAKLIKQKGITLTWYFVGDGEQRSDLESLIMQYGLSQEVLLTGFIKNPYNYMNSCDIYVQPSFEEAHATTIIEAMILQKPIVSTDTCAGRYFKKEYASCEVAATDPISLADTIIELSRNKMKMQQLVDNSARISWSSRKTIYRHQIDELLEGVMGQ